MKVNKEQMKKLAEKSDADLWNEIQKIAKSHGYNLDGKSPRPEDMEKIRNALLGVEKISMQEAVRIMNNYKKQK